MDNVFDAQYFGGSVHGVLLMVWVSFIRRDWGLKKTVISLGTGVSGRPIMKTRDLGSAYEVVALIVAKAARR